MGKHLTWQDRLTIERMTLKRYSVADIANAIGCSKSTIYNERKRSTYMHTDNHGFDHERYNPDGAQRRADRLKAKKRFQPKILQNAEYRHEIKRYILKEHYSPEAALFAVNNNGIDYGVVITSPATIYTAIRKGYIKGVSMIECPLHGKHRQHKQRISRKHKRKYGKSIDERDGSVIERNDFGHWEMDSVVGKNGSKQCLLVLTERKTRFEIIEPLKTHEASEVIRALKAVQKDYNGFAGVFKSITCDNGSEFAFEKQMKNIAPIYYAHPMSPYERGSNENANKLIRRHFPKGKKIETTRKDAKSVQAWMNAYPRRMFGGKSARDMFEYELAMCNP